MKNAHVQVWKTWRWDLLSCGRHNLEPVRHMSHGKITGEVCPVCKRRRARLWSPPLKVLVRELSLPSAASQMLMSHTRNPLHHGMQAIEQQHHKVAVEVLERNPGVGSEDSQLCNNNQAVESLSSDHAQRQFSSCSAVDKAPGHFSEPR